MWQWTGLRYLLYVSIVFVFDVCLIYAQRTVSKDYFKIGKMIKFFEKQIENICLLVFDKIQV